MEVPVFWPERRYPWGTAQAFNPDHSDLLHLRWAHCSSPVLFCHALIALHMHEGMCRTFSA